VWWGPPFVRPVPVRAMWVASLRAPSSGVVVVTRRWR
jgi:hypothetical protein